MVMKYWSAELFLKWATLIVSSLALLVACLRYPLALTLKATVQDVLRQELSRSDAIVAPMADECEIALLRHETGTSEANRRSVRQLVHRLFSTGTNLATLVPESLRIHSLPG